MSNQMHGFIQVQLGLGYLGIAFPLVADRRPILWVKHFFRVRFAFADSGLDVFRVFVFECQHLLLQGSDHVIYVLDDHPVGDGLFKA